MQHLTWPGTPTFWRAEKLSAKAKAKDCFKTITSARLTLAHWREGPRRDSYAAAHPGNTRGRSLRACSRRSLVNVRGSQSLERGARRTSNVGRLWNILAFHALANRPVPFFARHRACAVHSWAASLLGVVPIRCESP